MLLILLDVTTIVALLMLPWFLECATLSNTCFMSIILEASYEELRKERIITPLLRWGDK